LFIKLADKYEFVEVDMEYNVLKVTDIEKVVPLYKNIIMSKRILNGQKKQCKKEFIK
jgi:hypothetical protein